MKAGLPVEIVEAHPSAIYLGQVYTQDVVVLLDQGIEFRVFDPDLRVAPDMLGKERRVELVAGFGVVTPSPTDERDVYFDQEDRPVFRGLVTELLDDRHAILDVGSGSVRFPIQDGEDSIEVGDFLQITRASVQLKAVEGSRAFSDEYEVFLDKLSNGAPEDRKMAARYLGSKGSESGLDRMIQALRRDDDSEVRAEVATALGRIGMAARPPDEERDPKIESALEDALDDGNETVEEAARMALDDIEESDRDHMHSRDW